MKHILITAVTFVSLMSFVFPASAQGLCGERVDIIDTLKTRYQEAPISMGLAGNGGVVEVFASQKGSWTIVVTQPTGVTCVVSAGESWENLKGMVPGEQGV